MANRIETINFLEEIDGDTFGTKRFNFFESDGTTELDLSDATIKVQIRKDSYTGRLVQTAVSGDGVTWVDQSLGQFTLGGCVVDWGGSGDYYYDIQLTYGTSGIIRTYLRGNIKVIDQSTR